MIKYIIAIVVGGFVGLFTSVIGYSINTWQFWAIIIGAQIPIQIILQEFD